MSNRLVLLVVTEIYISILRPMLIELVENTDNKLDDKVILLLDVCLKYSSRRRNGE
ncbi:hypothetical protein LCGC14_1763390 [marine sediment metagenome]|uniref:Uncharacterized protein n=1 Tax=marine sediment metagenome TaxID=412755 RepID=A0A0F9K015_9ZZZZ